MMNHHHADLQTAMAAFVAHARELDATGSWTWAVCLFYRDQDGDARRTLLLDLGYGDRDDELIWGVNRLAKLLCADVAAWVETNPDRAVVSIERRGAEVLELMDVRTGDTRTERQPFEALPGGAPGGWGWHQHDGLRLDLRACTDDGAVDEDSDRTCDDPPCDDERDGAQSHDDEQPPPSDDDDDLRDAPPSGDDE